MRTFLHFCFGLLVSVLPSVCVHAQSTPEAVEMLRAVNARFNKVKDYTADARIVTKISFLNILPQQARVFYRKPDKFRLKAKGIAVLPKQNFDALFKLTADEKQYMAFVTGRDSVRRQWCTVVNLVPLADTGDLVLAKLWIDPAGDLILRANLTTRSSGTVVVDYEYGSLAQYALPDRATFTIDVKRFKIPKAVSADINSTSARGKQAPREGKGSISIAFSNYILNKGVPDAVFAD
ncbi:MAG: LolA family protein [Bacteroidota bacterium]